MKKTNLLGAIKSINIDVGEKMASDIDSESEEIVYPQFETSKLKIAFLSNSLLNTLMPKLALSEKERN
jgi:hypothetical protein